MKLDRFDFGWLGHAKTVTVTKEKTTIIDGNGTEEDITLPHDPTKQSFINDNPSALKKEMNLKMLINLEQVEVEQY